jgi:hypothetical protein
MQDPSSKSKIAGISFDLLNGFSKEFQKIAAAVGVADITKGLKNTMGTAKPKMISKPAMPELKEPSTTLDPIGSNRAISPPPITAG